MLNRKLLRIKVIQYLYAYKIADNVNYQLAYENIEKIFSPDILAKEEQDTQLLSTQKKEATEKFSQIFQGKTIHELKTEDIDINNSLERSFDYYKDNNRKDENMLREYLMEEGDIIFNEYLSFLTLLPSLISYEKQYYPKKYVRKKSLNEIFSSNWLYQSLTKDEEVNKAIEDKKINWNNDKDILEDVLRNIYKNNTFIEKTAEPEKLDFNQQKELIIIFFRDILLKNPVLKEYFDKKDLNWEINRPIVRSLVLNTFKKLESPEQFKKQDLSKNWEEDKNFAWHLFSISVKKYDEYQKYIEEKLVNWDIKRVALIDKIIIILGIAEMINFKEIPIKVTINEYIELAKQLSEENKKNFINGILDSIYKTLDENKLIRKSGRGLIDNQ